MRGVLRDARGVPPAPAPLRTLPRFGRLSVAFGLVASSALAADARPVTVGPLGLTAPEVARRLGALSPEELRAFGKEPGAARRAFVEQVLVPELLFRAEAERLGLPQGVRFRARENDLLYRALVVAERRALPAPSEADIAAYYAAHEAEFTRPRRLRLWRILVASEEDAKKILAEAAGAGGPERWRAAARSKSLDTATRERGGDLGFVHPDGNTDVPEVRVEKALYEAAERVADGALVPEPVREGSSLAVVWRRGSLNETRLSLDDARPTIVRLLTERDTTARVDALVGQLTATHVTQKNAALVENVSVPALPAPAPPPPSPAPAPPTPAK